MATQTQESESPLAERIVPIGKRVLIRKDDNKKATKQGIILPDSLEIPTLTGRIITVSAQVENDDDYPIKQYDKVIFDPRGGIPVELEQDNKLFVVDVEKVIAVIQRDKK